ncbi:MAG: arginine kinase [Desulfotignum sp.]|nr:arginine kinase [Desulfotignum sp.]
MKAETADQRLFPETSNALVKRFLTPSLSDRLSSLKTATGFTLAGAIRSGQQNADSSIGIYAGDAESYTLFKEIFDPVIRAYHRISGSVRHVSDLRHLDLPDLDPEQRFILSSRVRVARNLAGYAFTPHILPRDRETVKQKICNALAALPAPLQGQYHAMDSLTPGQIKKQTAADNAFLPGDRFQAAAGITRDFPASRGVYTGVDKKFFVWINEEDQMRIICLEKTGSLSVAFNRLVLALTDLGRFLEFASDPCLGFLNACPTNIGTAMRAGVHIRLPKLEQHPGLLKKLASDHSLQIRGTRGEKTGVTGSVFDISNRQRLGTGEAQLIKTLNTGIAAIIETEKNL